MDVGQRQDACSRTALRLLRTPRRNDRGSIRCHLPIDASVDVTEAREHDAVRLQRKKASSCEALHQRVGPFSSRGPCCRAPLCCVFRAKHGLHPREDGLGIRRPSPGFPGLAQGLLPGRSLRCCTCWTWGQSSFPLHPTVEANEIWIRLVSSTMMDPAGTVSRLCFCLGGWQTALLPSPEDASPAPRISWRSRRAGLFGRSFTPRAGVAGSFQGLLSDGIAWGEVDPDQSLFVGVVQPSPAD
jgi:hypothetical protein